MSYYIAYEANEYHHLIIKDITDKTYCTVPKIELSCYGYIYARDSSLPSGTVKDRYNITIVCQGPIMEYVKQELVSGDRIFVVGHSATATVNGYGRRVIKTECIYKEDWLNYIPEDDIYV